MNAVDLPIPQTFIVKKAEQKNTAGDLKVWIHLQGVDNRPYKMSKGMLRGLIVAWGLDEEKWTDRHLTIYCDPTVTWGGAKVGGIKISAVSDIEQPFSFNVRTSRTARYVHTFQVLQKHSDSAEKPFILTHVQHKLSLCKSNEEVDLIVNDVRENNRNRLAEIKEDVIKKRAEFK
ncbi:MAG: hypothetical protein KAH32_06605 [Chlamydiia bacterium]|nr:hypothetical protein [Chlamydiia bacterium]